MMRRFLIAVVFLAVLLGGCQGVMLNAEYTHLLDKTAALSAETAARAEADKLTPDEMKAALKAQSVIWQRFVDAREGRVSK